MGWMARPTDTLSIEAIDRKHPVMAAANDLRSVSSSEGFGLNRTMCAITCGREEVCDHRVWYLTTAVRGGAQMASVLEAALWSASQMGVDSMAVGQMEIALMAGCRKDVPPADVD